MDNLKLLRVQVAAKVAYLESDQAAKDCQGAGPKTYQHLMHNNYMRLVAFKEVLADIDTIEDL